MMVARVWSKHRLQPHRLERYMSSNDPDFEQKAADIIGLHLNPPAHAAVFCVDEKTAIQALDRNDPVLPLSPGRAERDGFEYYRHGTLALFAAFNTKTGEVIGKTAARHTSEQFVAFLREIVAHQPDVPEIHVIADDLSAHKTKRVQEFLREHPWPADVRRSAAKANQIVGRVLHQVQAMPNQRKRENSAKHAGKLFTLSRGLGFFPQAKHDVFGLIRDHFLLSVSESELVVPAGITVDLVHDKKLYLFSAQPGLQMWP